MKRSRTAAWAAVVMAGMLGATGRVEAGLITVSADGVGPVTIIPSSDTITLNASGPTTYNVTNSLLINVQGGTLFIGNSQIPNQVVPFSLTENITINGQTKSLTLTGTDNVTSSQDIVTINAGPTLFFSGASVTFKTQQVSVSGTLVGQQVPFTLQANITAAPEPGTIAMAASALPVGLVVWMRRRRVRATA
jgi:hypothetical protein